MEGGSVVEKRYMSSSYWTLIRIHERKERVKHHLVFTVSDCTQAFPVEKDDENRFKESHPSFFSEHA